MSQPARCEAPAKLTTSLHITGVRADGYHLIDAEMVTLDLVDILDIDPDGAPGLSLAGDTVTHATSAVPLGNDNLVMAALAAVGRTAAVRLHKNIPDGAGLGGGSADAAAVLRWAGVTDPAVAVRLGADVVFCVAGGRARVRGIGEIVEPLEPDLNVVVTLVTPPFHVSTPAVYARWDQLGGPDHPTNDLEPAALNLVPALGQWKTEVEARTGEVAHLAGSGATWFIYGDHTAALEGLAVEEQSPRLVTRARATGPTLQEI